MNDKEAEAWAKSVTFKVLNSDGTPKKAIDGTTDIILTERNNGLTITKNDDGTYSFDINPRIMGNDKDNIPGDSTWADTPFPNTDTYWALGTLTGTVTAPDGAVGEIEVEKVKIEQRVNIFDNPSLVSGSITIEEKNNDKSGISVLKNDIKLNSDYDASVEDKAPRYYCLSNDPDHTKIISLSDAEKQVKNGKIQMTEDDLKNANVEAYVRVKVGGTTDVWYKVASEPFSELMKRINP